MASYLYETEKECPLCIKSFKVTKVRNRLSMIKQDSDFCTYYKEVNPSYYTIWVCPSCGYAAQDTYFEEVPAGAAKIKNFLEKRTINVDFAGIRTRDQAIATYKLALYFAELGGTLDSKLASLYLKLAWIFREGNQEQEELAALDRAREHYEQAFNRERMPIGNMSEITLEYLCGELLRRTGRLAEAVHYLGKVVTNPAAKREKRVYEMARDAWHEARAARKKLEEAAAGESGTESGT